MTPEIISRAVLGLMLATLACIVGIVILAVATDGTEAITALATLGSGSAGAIAGLLTNAASPGAIIGGRRSSDPKPVPVETIDEAVHSQEAKAS